MSDIQIGLIIFAPFIIIFIGGIIFSIGENKGNKRGKKIEKIGETIIGIGSFLGIVWVILILVFVVPEISKMHRESRQLRESFR